MRRSHLAAMLSAAISASAYGAAINMGNLVVTVVGSGTSLSSAATSVNVREMTTAGVTVQDIAMPTSASGAQAALTMAGSATSEGFLKLSSNGQYLTLAGYNTAPGTASVAASAAASINRVVGRIDMAGNVDTSTVLSDAYDLSNIRSAVTTNGTDIWTAGNRGSGGVDNGGVRYLTFGSTSGSVRVNSGGTNRRVVDIHNGRLYETSGSSPFLAIQTMVSALPTVSETETTLPGMPTSGTRSNYDFWFANDNTVYIADDGSAAGAGIQKWTFDGTSWSQSYILLNTGTAATLVRGLTGYLDGLGNAVLFGTTGSTIVTVTDAGVDNDTATVVATAATGTAFRGIDYIPVIPEPASMGILATAALMLVRRRRNG